jgi:hypothetical protein
VKKWRKERKRLATTIWDAGHRAEEAMRREEIGAHHLRATTSAAAANAAFERLQRIARLGLRRWSGRWVCERLGDSDWSGESLGDFLCDLCGTRIRCVGNRNNAHLERFVAAAQHEASWSSEESQFATQRWNVCLVRSRLARRYRDPRRSFNRKRACFTASGIRWELRRNANNF